MIEVNSNLHFPKYKAHWAARQMNRQKRPIGILAPKFGRSDFRLKRKKRRKCGHFVLSPTTS